MIYISIHIHLITPQDACGRSLQAQPYDRDGIWWWGPQLKASLDEIQKIKLQRTSKTLYESSKATIKSVNWLSLKDLVGLPTSNARAPKISQKKQPNQALSTAAIFLSWSDCGSFCCLCFGHFTCKIYHLATASGSETEGGMEVQYIFKQRIFIWGIKLIPKVHQIQVCHTCGILLAKNHSHSCAECPGPAQDISSHMCWSILISNIQIIPNP